MDGLGRLRQISGIDGVAQPRPSTDEEAPVNCPHCESTATTSRKSSTTLGYRRFNCRSCKRRFNERTGTPFNDLQYPTDVVLLAVLWRLRYKLSFRDVAEMLLQRGIEATHETIRIWEFRFAPLLAEQLRAKRRGHTLAARGAGVTRQNAYQTRSRNKTFRRLWEEALDEAVDLLYGEARRRATGIKRDVWYAGEKVGTETVYSDKLLMFLFRAHRPHLYRDNVKVEHPGGMDVTGDRKVTFEFVNAAEEHARTLAERPELAEQHARTLAELAAEEAEEAEETP